MIDLYESLNGRENLRNQSVSVSITVSRMPSPTGQNEQSTVTTEDDKVRVVYPNSSEDVDMSRAYAVQRLLHSKSPNLLIGAQMTFKSNTGVLPMLFRFLAKLLTCFVQTYFTCRPADILLLVVYILGRRFHL
jgi:hypothetical protein